MDELKYLDSPKITEDQAICLLIKHFQLQYRHIYRLQKRIFSVYGKNWEKSRTKIIEVRLQSAERRMWTQKQMTTMHTSSQNRYKNQLNHRPPLYNNSFRENPTGSNKSQEKVY